MQSNIRSQLPDVEEVEAVDDLSAAELKTRLDDGQSITVLDTRQPDAVEEWPLSYPNATVVNVPFTEFIEDGQPVDEIPAEVPTGPLVVSCGKGISSRFVAKVLTAAGRDVEALIDGMEGWAQLYTETPVDVEASADTILQYHRPSSGCLAYLIVDNGEAAVIDPLRAFAQQYRDTAATHGATLTYAIDTHVHADHISGIHALGNHDEIEAVMPARADTRGLQADVRRLAEGDRLTIGDVTIEAVALPGHTTEMTGYRVGELLITGDSLFIDGIARPDLEDPDQAHAAADTLYETFQWFAQQPPSTVIGPGHITQQTAVDRSPPYVDQLETLHGRIQAFELDRTQFIESLLADMPPRPSNFQEIIAVNLGQTVVDGEEAFELELGPNNCAAGAD